LANVKSIRTIPFSAAALLVLACALLAVVGCSTGDHADNVSERPWNNTQGWQGGLPSGLNEGR